MITPEDCSEGFYRHITNGRTEADDCYSCKEGYYCPSPGTQTLNTANICDPGFWCFAEATESNPSTMVNDKYGPCPAFHYCEGTTGRGMVCPPGTYRESEQGQTSGDCTSIHSVYPGEVSNTITGYESATMNKTDCHPGYYCPSTSDAKTGSQVGFACTPGHYCEGKNTAEEECPAGTITFNYQSRKCYDCPPGYYCPASASSWINFDPTGADISTIKNTITDWITNNKCDPGYYCPSGSSTSTEYACPLGTYNPNYGAKSVDECIPAPPGYYIDTEGASDFGDGSGGFKKCDGGHYCKLGSFLPNPTSSTNKVGIMSDGRDAFILDIGGEC